MFNVPVSATPTSILDELINERVERLVRARLESLFRASDAKGELDVLIERAVAQHIPQAVADVVRCVFERPDTDRGLAHGFDRRSTFAELAQERVMRVVNERIGVIERIVREALEKTLKGA